MLEGRNYEVWCILGKSNTEAINIEHVFDEH